MKKILTFIFSLLLILFIAGCTPETSNPEDNIPEDNGGETTPDDTDNDSDKDYTGDDDSGETGDDDDSNQDDFGTMTINDLTIYSNFPNRPIVEFSNPDYKVLTKDIIFTYDEESILFDGECFKALKINQTVKVTAETPYHTTEFNVITKDYVTACKDENNATAYLDRVNQKLNYWKNNGAATNGTLFIGDSFFDTQFWSNFYTLYKGNNAYTNGVSSSTTTDWEIWASTLVYPLNPENIVMHCGTNNLYDDKETAAQTIENTKRLLDTIHYHLPNTKIYYFAIEPRTYGIGTSTFDSVTYSKILTVNKAMKKYCEDNDYMVFLDVTENCYTSEMVVNSSFFRDGVHPTLENYIVYAEALEKAGLNLTINVDRETTSSLTFTSDMAINKGDSAVIKENGKVMVKEFSISGKIHVSQVSGNAHIQFAFEDTAANRFLLWDNDNDNSLRLGYACNNQYASNLSTKGAYLNVIVSFELVVTVNNAYLYLDNQLAMVFINVNPTAVYIGTEGCAVSFTNLAITSKINNSTQYNTIISRTEINRYETGNYAGKQVVVL